MEDKKPQVEGTKSLEATCASEACAYRGKGVCDFKEGQFCPMYQPKQNGNGKH